MLHALGERSRTPVLSQPPFEISRESDLDPPHIVLRLQLHDVENARTRYRLAPVA